LLLSFCGEGGMVLVSHGKPKTTKDCPVNRGIFVTNYPKKVIFTKQVVFKTSELPRWKPSLTIGALKPEIPETLQRGRATGRRRTILRLPEYENEGGKEDVMKREIELLRKIATEAQSLWNKNLLPLNAITLKNLLSDRSQPVQPTQKKKRRITMPVRHEWCKYLPGGYCIRKLATVEGGEAAGLTPCGCHVLAREECIFWEDGNCGYCTPAGSQPENVKAK